MWKPWVGKALIYQIYTYDLVKFFILLVSIIWEVFIQVILGDSVHDIFLSAGSSVLSHSLVYSNTK